MTIPRIFIGSSTESKEIAQIVRKHLEPFCDCVVWSDKNFFKANESTYKNLVKKAFAFDFAIFIGGRDDIAFRTQNHKIKKSPRDNVYVEFGLYAGILSTDRTYFLVDKECDIATDLLGITLFIYSNEAEIEDGAKSILETIHREYKLNRIQFLPSTSLAIGYYENFIKPAANILFSKEKITINKKEYDIKGCFCQLKICVPNDPVADFKSQAEKLFKLKGYQKAELESELRNLGLLIDIDAFEKEHKIVLYDCPQTLRAAFRAVELATAIDNIGPDENIQLVKEKEVRNFVNTLRNLIETNAHTKSLIEVVSF